MYEQDLLDPTKLLNRRISQLENELDYYKTLTKEYKQKIELEQIANHDLRLQNIALEKENMVLKIFKKTQYPIFSDNYYETELR